MKTTAFIAFSLFALLLFAHMPAAALAPYEAANAIDATLRAQAGEGTIGEESGIYAQGWLNDWRAAGIIAVAISLALVALAYIFGFALNSREMKMWAGIELAQVFGSMIIIAGLLGIVTFFDVVAAQIAQGTMEAISYGSACTQNLQMPCSMHVADTYLSMMLNASSDSALGMLGNSLSAARAASARSGIQTYSVLMLWSGGSYGPNAGMSMLVDKYNVLFDYYAKIGASLHAQRYFIEVITFGVGPLFLLVGVILRTFFFTRKLGGLLLALAVALMVIYPLTYIFSWLTLVVSIYGDNMFALSDACPAECRSVAPLATYIANDGTKFNINSTDELEAALNLGALELDPVDQDAVYEIPGADEQGYFFPAGDDDTFIACADLDAQWLQGEENVCADCPSTCREVPYPSYNSMCLQKDVEQACRQCDVRCKVVRLREASSCESESVCGLTQQQLQENDACLVQQPMEEITIDADTKIPQYPQTPADNLCEECAQCPAFCRVRIQQGDEYASRGDMGVCDTFECRECALGTLGKCAITVQQVATQTCNQLCGECPAWCRVNGDLPDGCPSACEQCPSECKATVPQDGLCAAAPDGDQGSYCQSCPNSCRYNDYEVAPDSFNFQDDEGDIYNGVCADYAGSGMCDASSCNAQCKAYGLVESAENVPRICRGWASPQVYPCESCLFACRVKLTYTLDETQLYGDRTAKCVSDDGNPLQLCDDGCEYPCMQTFELPSGPGCHAFEDETPINGPNPFCEQCPYKCRILENGEVPEECDTPAMHGACLAAKCSNSCKVELSAVLGSDLKPPFCMPYLGNGIIGASPQNEMLPIAERDAPYNIRGRCRQCPEECRIVDDETVCNLDSEFYDCSLQNCANECRVEIPHVDQPTDACMEYSDSFCKGCPLECRLIGAGMPDSEWNERCAGVCTNCIDECKATVPQAVCADKTLLACEQDCLGVPQVRTDCAEQCTQEELSGPSRITPASFITKVGGAEGDSLTKNVGVLMIPAVVLPLFNIVLILSFVRVLSPIFGGDVEIPGIARLI